MSSHILKLCDFGSAK